MVVFVVTLRFLPPLWCSRGAGAWWEGDAKTQAALGNGVGRWLDQRLETETYATGDQTFDGEWLFGTYQMAILGLVQTAEEHPELRAEALRRIARAEELLLSKAVRRFDHREWKEDALDSLGGMNGHAGYLGYLNLALGMHRKLEPDFKYRLLHDQISEALARRLDAAAICLLETYPGQTFPVDNCAVAASLRWMDRVEGTNRFAATYQRWITSIRKNYVDRKTGLVFQSVGSRSGAAMGPPRASGSLLGAYFLGLAGEPLAKEIFVAARAELWAPFAGFGAVREYPSTVPAGRGDIDSGPLIFGRSLSASGFMMACARQHGDEATFGQLYRSVHLVGAPTRHGDVLGFAMGGPLGDSMMLALLTAQPLEKTKDKP